MKYFKIIAILFIAVVGLIAASFIIGNSLKKFQNDNRRIYVKGLAEQEVKSDLAVWKIKAKILSNNVKDASAEIDIAKNKVVNFLSANGLSQSEIILNELVVNDRMSKDYINYDRSSYRFIVTKTIEVRSKNVDTVDKISKMIDRLLQDGVIIDNENPYETQVRYYFTKLNDIKPSMLRSANQNAKQAAIQFANEQEVRLGRLKEASQGTFSIVDRESSLSGSDYSDNHSIYKNVRVIVSVTYSIE